MNTLMRERRLFLPLGYNGPRDSRPPPPVAPAKDHVLVRDVYQIFQRFAIPDELVDAGISWLFVPLINSLTARSLNDETPIATHTETWKFRRKASLFSF